MAALKPPKDRPSELLRRAGQILSGLYLDPLSIVQASVLRTLLHRGPLTQRGLSGFSAIDTSTLGEMLKRLHKAGFVASVRLETDKRATLVSLTPAGRAALLKAERRLDDAEGRFLLLLPAAERAPFLRALRMISENSK